VPAVYCTVREQLAPAASTSPSHEDATTASGVEVDRSASTNRAVPSVRSWLPRFVTLMVVVAVSPGAAVMTDIAGVLRIDAGSGVCHRSWARSRCPFAQSRSASTVTEA